MITCNLVFTFYGACTIAYFPLRLIKQYIYAVDKPEATQHVLSKRVLRKFSEELILKGREIYRENRELDMEFE